MKPLGISGHIVWINVNKEKKMKKMLKSRLTAVAIQTNSHP